MGFSLEDVDLCIETWEDLSYNEEDPELCIEIGGYLYASGGEVICLKCPPISSFVEDISFRKIKFWEILRLGDF